MRRRISSIREKSKYGIPVVDSACTTKVHGVLSDPALKSVYASEAQMRKMRACDLVMSDFLSDPVIASVDSSKNNRAQGWLLIMTGDNFKVVRGGVVFRSAASSSPIKSESAPPAHDARECLRSRSGTQSPVDKRSRS
jgi:hypothetical protein